MVFIREEIARSTLRTTAAVLKRRQGQDVADGFQLRIQARLSQPWVFVRHSLMTLTVMAMADAQQEDARMSFVCSCKLRLILQEMSPTILHAAAVNISPWSHQLWNSMDSDRYERRDGTTMSLRLLPIMRTSVNKNIPVILYKRRACGHRLLPAFVEHSYCKTRRSQAQAVIMLTDCAWLHYSHRH